MVTELVQSPGSLLEQEQEHTYLHSLAERRLARKVPSDTMQLPVTHHYCEPLRASAATSRLLQNERKQLTTAECGHLDCKSRHTQGIYTSLPGSVTIGLIICSDISEQNGIPRFACISFHDRVHLECDPNHRKRIHIARQRLHGYDDCLVFGSRKKSRVLDFESE